MSKILSPELIKHQREIQRALRNKRYERTGPGLYLTDAKVEIGGWLKTEFFRHPLMHEARESGDPERISRVSRMLHAVGNLMFGEYERFALDEGKNIVPNAALDHILDSEFSSGAIITTRYLGISDADLTPAAAWTPASITSHFTTYDEATRPQWQEDGVSSQSITNSPTTSDGEFTCNNVASDDIYLAFLINNSTKDGTADGSAHLSAAKRFTNAPRAVEDNDKIHLTYSLTLSSS